MKQRTVGRLISVIVSDLKSCSVRRDLERGKRVHEKAVESGNDSNIYVATALVKLYAKCGSMVESRRVFDGILKPDVISLNVLLLGYAENGDGQGALDLFSRMKADGFEPNSVTYVAAIKACTSLAIKGDLSSKANCLQRGKEIHLEIGCHLNHFVQSTLIDMYAKCGDMLDARSLFDSIQNPDVVSWNVLLMGYVENGDGLSALELFSRMKERGCVPSSVTYVAAVKACTCLAVNADDNEKEYILRQGKKIHSEIGLQLDHWIQNTLIDMYAKCGSMVDARRVFDGLQNPDVVSWNVLLLGYAENGDGLATLELFSRMKARPCAVDSVTYIAALKACISLAVKGDGKGDPLQRGKEIHMEIGCHLNNYVQGTLIDMYAKCGSMSEARGVFDNIQNPKVVSWNVLLLGYAENGDGLTTLELFSEMKARGCVPSSVTYVAAIKACICLAVNGDKGQCLERGIEIHTEIGACVDRYLLCTLMDMYARCGSMVDARRTFDSIQKPDVVSWNVLLLGYAENGDGLNALKLFSKMKLCGCEASSVTYLAAFKACISLAINADCNGKKDSLQRGREIHLEIGTRLDHCVLNTLVDMYSKCGSMVEAHRVFDSIKNPDVVSWNVLLLGYVEGGDGLTALKLFSWMKMRAFARNSVTYVAAVKACTSLAVNGDSFRKRDCLEQGREIHSEIGPYLDYYVRTALIDMYAKCCSMVEARLLFDTVQHPDVVCWTALLLGYAENGEGAAALDLFSTMKAHGCAPNSVTYIAALKACISLAMNGEKTRGLGVGRDIHSEISCDMDLCLLNTLTDMYAKCGSMVDASRVFACIQKPDVVSWNVLLIAHAESGNGHKTLELFFKMKVYACEPDSVTYIAALKGCSLIGDLALGRKFHSEISEFTAHLVTCLVDFYAKCGSMVEARQVFDSHSGTRDISTWNALLAGYGSFDIASVFNLFEAMQDEGFRPDAITFVCLLLCCSHAGLVEKARDYFEAMPLQYGVNRTLIHYNCMVDVLGRVNQLNEAIGLLQTMPCNPNEVTWMTLLGACRKWKNVEIGRWAFQSLVELDRGNASAYVQMADICHESSTQIHLFRVSNIR